MSVRILGAGWLVGLLLVIGAAGSGGHVAAQPRPTATPGLGVTVYAPPVVMVTATPSPTPYLEPDGCQRPPDDYTRVWVGAAQFNARTLAMLDHAEALYQAQGGIIDFRPAVTQGGYNAGGVAASFGTHDAGGAVDISVRSPLDWSVLEDEIEPMIRALRVAGFAAWLRDTDQLYAGSPIHIHAIAVGDAELSTMARAQIDGTFGYLRGFNALPQPPGGAPIPDEHGGPVICDWMRDMGFDDLRGQPVPSPTPGGTANPG